MRRNRITGLIGLAIVMTAATLVITVAALAFGSGAKSNRSQGANIEKATITNGGVTESFAKEDVKESDRYVVKELDPLKNSLTVVSLQTGNQLRFDYGMETEFVDRFGNYEVWSKFVPGTVVTLGTVKKDSTVNKVSMYDGTFRFDNISAFTLDEKINLLTLADEKYIISSRAAIFSGDDIISAGDIKDGDIISVVGEGREVYCIMVTSSNGILKLTNTEKFDGSVIEIGDKIFAEVERNLEIEVPEGTYTVTVANNGYGGTCDVVVSAGQKTALDLSNLEGEGPRTCRLRFAVENPDCSIYLDGKKVDNYSIQTVTYGTHTLVVSADGYDTWKKYLVVNSETAEISIGLDESDREVAGSSAATPDAAGNEGASSGTTSTNGTLNSAGGTAGSVAGSLAGNTAGNAGNLLPNLVNNGNFGTNLEDRSDTELEYYSTLSNLISTLLQ